MAEHDRSPTNPVDRAVDRNAEARPVRRRRRYRPLRMHLTVESKDLLFGDEAADVLSLYATVLGDRAELRAYGRDQGTATSCHPPGPPPSSRRPQPAPRTGQHRRDRLHAEEDRAGNNAAICPDRTERPRKGVGDPVRRPVAGSEADPVPPSRGNTRCPRPNRPPDSRPPQQAGGSNDASETSGADDPSAQHEQETRHLLHAGRPASGWGGVSSG